MSDGTHHPLSPSNWPAWVNCGAYQGEDRSDSKSDRGTNVHKHYQLLIEAHNKNVKPMQAKSSLDPTEDEEEFEI